MKNIISLLFITNGFFSFGQSLEIYGGPGRNSFFDLVRNQPHYESEYKSASGYSAGLALDSLMLNRFEMRFSLQYDSYGGDIWVREAGQGGGSTTRAKINKSAISLGFYPVNFRFKRFNLSAGAEFSCLAGEEFSGTYYSWAIWGPSQLMIYVKNTTG